MGFSDIDEIKHITTKFENQGCIACDTWDFFVGTHLKQVKVCVHLDIETLPTKEIITEQLVRYLHVFENIKRNIQQTRKG